MVNAISNTSPLLYLYRIGAIEFLPKLFDQVWTPQAVVNELIIGRTHGYDVPDPEDYAWLNITNPKSTPSEWLVLDLGTGETATMALALENPTQIVLLDDMLARRTAQSAGLEVWGTLKILLEYKSEGYIQQISPFIDSLSKAGISNSSCRLSFADVY
jgi:predicted nucleic acid-binding protein